MGTPGSASGLGKRARSNPGTAPQADSTDPPFGAVISIFTVINSGVQIAAFWAVLPGGATVPFPGRGGGPARVRRYRPMHPEVWLATRSMLTVLSVGEGDVRATGGRVDRLGVAVGQVAVGVGVDAEDA